MSDAPRSPARVAETHTATLFFSGDRVYKVKKPVRYDFVDLSTRRLRQIACRREVDLNRRFAPDVYLGVATIVDEAGRPYEHAVVMRRLPEDRRLSRLLRRPEAFDRIREVARMIASFHARAPGSSDISGAGTLEAVRTQWRDNLREMQPFAGRHVAPHVLAGVGELAERFLAGRAALFDQRRSSGRIRDGHGDLLSEDIFCLPDGPRILDCLEFSDALRHGDVVADIAFLAMDLEYRGRPDLGAHLLASYREFSGDNAPAGLVHVSIAYRALVRAKVACLRAEQTGGEAPQAKRLLDLARAHLERARVRLVVVGGPPGSGKTTLTHALAGARGIAHVHSDETRKELAGIGHLDRPLAGFRGGLYRPEMTERTYAEMLRRARTLLASGVSVVLDASWLDRSLRDRAAACAGAGAADLTELRCALPPAPAADRIATRDASASDATAAIAKALRASADPWPGAVRLDATLPQDEVLRRALRALDRRPEPDPWDALFAAQESGPAPAIIRLEPVLAPVG